MFCPSIHIQSWSSVMNTNIIRHPFIITGMSNEKFPRNATTFNETFGRHKVLARRTRFASHRDEEKFCEFEKRSGFSEKDDPHVTVHEFLSHMGEDHIILFDNEPGMSLHEQEFLNGIRRFRSVPNMLKRAEQTLFFSFGGGRQGVEMANHGFTWIHLISGQKRWYVAPPSEYRPHNPTCSKRGQKENLGPQVLTCTQYAGEIFVLPTAWWHATCNDLEFTVGVGGQDSCDLGCQEEGRKGGAFCHDVSRQETCWN